jgi:hypothetical protein
VLSELGKPSHLISNCRTPLRVREPQMASTTYSSPASSSPLLPLMAEMEGGGQAEIVGMSTDGCCFLLRVLGPDGCRAYEPTKRSAAKRCGCWRFRPLLLLLSLRTDLAANRPGRVAIVVVSAEVRFAPSFPASLLVSETQAVLPAFFLPPDGGLHTQQQLRPAPAAGARREPCSRPTARRCARKLDLRRQ